MFGHKFWTSLLAIVFTIGLGYYAMSSIPASAGPSDKVKGWVWSDNIGWIKMNNCDFQNVCTTPAFGVNYDSAGIMSGYAWSDNIGWVTFNQADLSGCPSGTCNARINLSATPRRMEGWARVIALENPNDTETPADWADGWISLYDTAPTAYGPTFSATGSGSGFAWGSEVLGWLDFSLVSLDVVGTPIVQITSHTISACPAPFSVTINGQVDPNGHTPLPLSLTFRDDTTNTNILATISSASGPVTTAASVSLPVSNAAYPFRLIATDGITTWEDSYTIYTPDCGTSGSSASVSLAGYCSAGVNPQGIMNVNYTNTPSAACTITGVNGSYTFTTNASGNGTYSFNANNDTYSASCTFSSTTISTQTSETVYCSVTPPGPSCVIDPTPPACNPNPLCTNPNGCTTPGTRKPIFKEI